MPKAAFVMMQRYISAYGMSDLLLRVGTINNKIYVKIFETYVNFKAATILMIPDFIYGFADTQRCCNYLGDQCTLNLLHLIIVAKILDY